MGNIFRRQPFATTYEPLKTPVGEDDVQVGLLTAFGMIAFSFLLIIPGIRGLEVNTLLHVIFVYCARASNTTDSQIAFNGCSTRTISKPHLS